MPGADVAIRFGEFVPIQTAIFSSLSWLRQIVSPAACRDDCAIAVSFSDDARLALEV